MRGAHARSNDVGPREAQVLLENEQKIVFIDSHTHTNTALMTALPMHLIEF
jgi:hypothetical protein